MEKGIIRVTKNFSGKINKKYPVPKFYKLEPKEDYHGKACEFLLDDKNKVLKVFVDGDELPRDTEVEKEIEAKKKRKEERAEREKQEEEEKKKNAALIKALENDIFKLEETFCPKDTKGVEIQKYQVENFALKLNKFAYYDDEDRKSPKFLFFKSRHKKSPLEIQPNFAKINFQAIVDREKSNAVSFLGQDNVIDFTSKTAGRFVTGLGGASVYDTNITLHHIYGIPYIPASTIKGVLRSFIITEKFGYKDDKEDLVGAEDRALDEDKNPNFVKIFGDQNKKGEVIFFDAFPTTAPKIAVDIMTPHYGEYYGDVSNKKAPDDTQMPVPVPFLTVADTTFQFIIGSRKFKLDEPLWEFELNEKKEKLTLVKWLQAALEHHGIGAKTAVGYGYFASKKNK